MSDADFSGIRLGVNAVALLSPLTGIGQYTRHLASELGQLMPRQPLLFYGSDWSDEIRPSPAPVPDSMHRRIKSAIPMGYRISRSLQQWRFSAGVRRHRIGLYHEPNYLAFRFAGPTVVTVHDLSWIRHPDTHPAERVRSMNETMPRVLRDAAQIIVDSEFTRREVLDHYALPPEKVTTVLLGVSSEFRRLEREACAPVLEPYGLRYGEYILTVSTLEPRKNLATVIAAFSRLPAPLRKRFPLAIVGMSGWGMRGMPAAIVGMSGGGTQGMPEGFRQMVVAGEARLLGYIPQEAMPMLYSGARAFVYPSLYEGFGLPPLEAMACGVPAIVSDRASLPEVVGDAGIVVDALDDAGLAESVRAVLEDDALHTRLSAAGIEHAAQFTWRRCALETMQVYRKALFLPLGGG